MKRITKILIDSNRWYDRLPDHKRFMFFLFVIIGGFAVADYLFYVKDQLWAFPTYFFLVGAWRLPYIFM